MDFDKEQRKLNQLTKNLESSNDKKNAYKNILETYPLLFGYWIKYAALDQTIWKQALEKCPNVELWTAFLDSQNPTLADLENATNSVGLYFQSHQIWDRYLAALESRPRAVVLRRLVQIPLYAYAQYYKLALEAAKQHPDVFEGLDLAAVAKQTAQAVNERWAYEKAISRHYFHVLALPQKDLETWKAYLAFVEAQGDPAATKALYVRCLEATALYQEFWMQFVRWQSLNSEPEVDGLFECARIYARTTNDSSKLLVEQARYREAAGDTNGARALLQQVQGTKGQQALRSLEKRTAPPSTENLLERHRRGEGTDTELCARLQREGRLAEFFEVETSLWRFS